MKSETLDAVDVVWDLGRERLSIGGALVLRQEGEMLARLQGRSALMVHLIAQESGRQAAERMAQTIFGTSTYPHHLADETELVAGWPPAAVRSRAEFSYFAFSRTIALHAQTDLKPRLQWRESQQALAMQARRHFLGRLYCVHLRSVAPFAPEESNADGPAWNAFFQRRAAAGQCDFLLIGDDPLLASPVSAWTTGSCFHVNGGKMASAF